MGQSSKDQNLSHNNQLVIRNQATLPVVVSFRPPVGHVALAYSYFVFQLQKMEAVPVIDEELSLLNSKECEASAIAILKQIRPDWPEKSIQFKVYTAGITNKIFAVYVDPAEQLIFRVFGKNTEQIIDRKAELESWKKLAKFKMAAPLFAHFKNGLVCGYLEGDTLEVQQLRDPKIQRSIARKIAQLHMTVPHSNEASLFPKMRQFRKALKENFEDEEKQKVFDTEFTEDLCSLIDSLEEKIKLLNEKLAFCHNDLLVHNIVMNKAGAINFIDYEYASTNFELFDLANHFCEHAGVTDPNYDLCPDKAQKLVFLYDYLKARHEVADEKRLREMIARTPLFEAASHLFWALWALVQSQYSTIDFDYLGYAVLRFQQYRKRLAKYDSQL
ncbi:unnamed protein product [Caenorhabditis auriculariae]|uniref:ethanolamine kinase n=1 Tax=Caenorhabditis auriculariae TaxID=2777116 RepID=A0A8S1H7L3_9PELO|nr:unnamed protein product [Caenorhabditis auriculariae]